MNPLQGIDQIKPLFVSLNPPFEPDPATDLRPLHVRPSAIHRRRVRRAKEAW